MISRDIALREKLAVRLRERAGASILALGLLRVPECAMDVAGLEVRPHVAWEGGDVCSRRALGRRPRGRLRPG
jgi:hypothetical protein